MDHCLSILTCPVCGAALTREHSSPFLQCISRHTFDLAREGYVNLLLKKLPGDTKEMLLARRSFLSHGYYEPLSQAINTLVLQYLSQQAEQSHELASINILDAGCGEGYYLGRLKEYLADLPSWGEKQCCYLGFDISKEAVKMAAKRYKAPTFVVANINQQLVLASSSIAVLLNIFAPRNPGEFARVLAPRGLLLIVIPSPIHLLSLRSVLPLLTIEADKQQRVIAQFADSFTLLETSTLEYEIVLENEELLQLVHMTPNHWHLSESTQQMLQTMQDMRTEVGFICLLFQKRP